MRKIITDIQYTLLQFCRSPQAVFFTLAFPLLFLVLAWYMPGWGSSAAGTGLFDFALPCIVGIAVMGSSLDLAVGFIANYRETGVLRKLAVTPLSRTGWNLSRAAAGTIVALSSVAVTLIIAWMAFGVHPVVNLLLLPLVVAGSVAFTGIGMVISRVIKDGDAASAASFTLTLPLILVSGTLFPADRLPGFLQAVAAISPLTYLNEGLRAAVLTGDTAAALVNLAIVAGYGIVLFCAGVVTLKWKEG
ncbi:ABC transporter permease [Methanocella sp. MCL-LM]|uniref:ABC transporter permease n=1 Tax=Methanocella sp. MCL-LM TaxID=3412035 RepID=UPI003C72E02A